MAPFVPQNSDPDYEFYNFDKSHNSAFYKQTPGVCTTKKDELQAILRTTTTGPGPSPLGTNLSQNKSNDSDHESGDSLNVMDISDHFLDPETSEMTSENVKKKKRKNKKRFRHRKKSGNLSRYSKRELEREIARNTQKLNDKIQIEFLRKTLGDPWDSISFHDKKHFALHFYFTKLQVFLKLV
jgi:hypothetical protein